MKLRDTSLGTGRSALALRAAVNAPASTGILRHSPSDALLVGLAALHGALLVLVPSVPLVALGLWWNANTVSHNFIHLPFFRSRVVNWSFSAYLSLLLGFPQSLWRARHLAHHRDEPFQWRPVPRAWVAEGALVLAMWAVLSALAPSFFQAVYLPGWLVGLGLCQIQGHFEHARGAVSHHGRIYNWLFFNDGYHLEHHARPARHWTKLARESSVDAARVSRWPAVLRWLEHASLDGLEELVCRCGALRQFVLEVHERAWKKVLAGMPPPRRIVIVGGGLFPRTALILRRLAPDATLVIVDLREDRIERARIWLDERVEFVRGFCTPENLVSLAGDADLVVVPLALRGNKSGFYRMRTARHLVVHDWVWLRRGRSVVVSWALLKRLNLVTGRIQERSADSLVRATQSSSQETRGQGGPRSCIGRFLNPP
ncbi:MAG TPA: fatty acid desaturase [Verrucomicrobiae bacterium]|nr:fatty acid desaturase [Verrucomicrobiae bacterium]